MSKERKNCMCTAMLFDPAEAEAKIKAAEEAKAAKEQSAPKAEPVLVTPDGELVHHRHREFKGNFKLFERWVRFKQFVLLKSFRKKDENADPSDKKRSLLSIFFW
jgi:hypothetical protein